MNRFWGCERWPFLHVASDFLGDCFVAKRLECAELAPAFERVRPFESAGKPGALQTLRAVRLRLSGLCLVLLPLLISPDFRPGAGRRDGGKVESVEWQN